MTMLEEALKAAAKGWEVFPIRRGTKDGYFYYPEYPGEPSDKYPKGTPYSWKAQASKDPERVRKFWTDHPDANIGAATGQRSGGLFVVDEDEKDDRQGIANFEKWIDDNMLYLDDDGVMAKTPSGGRHEYFTAKGEIVPTRGDWLPGVDIRGEHNGYVLLPPSYYEDPTDEYTGFYEWITSPEEGSVPTPEDNADIIDIAVCIARDTYGRALDPDGNPIPFTAVNGEIWEGRKRTGAGHSGDFPRNEQGKIIKGVRHEYIINRCGYYVSKLKDTDTSAEAILALVMQDFRDNCEDPHIVKKDPAPGALSAIKKFQAKMPEYEKDPNWNRYCIFAWRAEHEGEEWDREKVSWADTAAAGLRARESELTLEELREKVLPSINKEYEEWRKNHPKKNALPEGENTAKKAQEGEEGTTTPAKPEEPPKDPIEAFLEEINSRRFEPISTGIKDIDRALQGGFLRRTLITLAAAPGAGKTALACWVFETMAASGHDVLYLNLEMDRAQLLARSISRIAWRLSGKRSGGGFSALDVLRAYEWTPEQHNYFLSALEEYKARIAPHFVHNPDTLEGSNDIKRILAVMQEEVNRVKAAGRPEPLICVDYLQIIAADASTTAEGIQVIIKALKDFAIQNNTVVFLITAQNRASNKSGVSEMESGRDTSAIEYTGDIMLGLVYTAIEDGWTWTYYERDEEGKIQTDKDGRPKKKIKTYDLDRIRELQRKAYEEGTDPDPVCNKLTLKVLKNRFGAAERRANLIFDGEHGTFHQVEREGRPDPDPDQQDKRGEWQQGTLPEDVSAAF